MKMKLIKRGEEADVLLIGRLDVNSAPEVEKALLDIVERFQSVNLDLAQLEYISSAGLRTIKNFNIASRRKGGNYTVRNIPKQIMEIFEATGFIRLLKM